jgi:hypothetical protein
MQLRSRWVDTSRDEKWGEGNRGSGSAPPQPVTRSIDHIGQSPPFTRSVGAQGAVAGKASLKVRLESRPRLFGNCPPPAAAMLSQRIKHLGRLQEPPRQRNIPVRPDARVTGAGQRAAPPPACLDPRSGVRFPFCPRPHLLTPDPHSNTPPAGPARLPPGLPRHLGPEAPEGPLALDRRRRRRVGRPAGHRARPHDGGLGLPGRAGCVRGVGVALKWGGSFGRLVVWGRLGRSTPPPRPAPAPPISRPSLTTR